MGGSEPRGGLAALVLAAGRATRFGSPKQLAPWHGTALVAHVVRRVLASVASPVVVVLGHRAEEVRAVLPDDPRVEPIINRRYADGIASSLHAGIAALDDAVVGVAVVLGDVPAVEPHDIDAVLRAVAEGHEAARVRYLDGPGHPVAFGRTCWPQLRSVSGDTGASSVLPALRVKELAVPRHRPEDVDRPDDLLCPPLPGEVGRPSDGAATR